MLQDLQMILEGEAEARRQFDAARQQAAQLICEAEEDAHRRVDAAREAREAEARAVEEQIVAAARVKARQIATDAAAAAAALRRRAEPLLTQAVDAVIAAVLPREVENDR